MTTQALSADAVAARIGRSRAWLYEHWRGLVAARKLPPPLLGGAAPLAWDEAQLNAVLDHDLTPAARVAAAAYRSAAAAAHAALAPGARDRLDDAAEVQAARARLDRRITG